MSHTEGKLLVLDCREVGEKYISICNEKVVVARIQNMVSGRPLDDEDLANARRLVACWNACDGIKTEALENALSVSEQPMRETSINSALLVEDNNRLILERAELLSAATKILDAVLDNERVPLNLVLELKDALDRIKS